MTEGELTPERFGNSFQRFMDAVSAAAVPPRSPLLERIRAHLGAEPAQLPVIAEELDSFEHPNLQVALDAYVGSPDRETALVGVAAEAKRYRSLTLSDLVGQTAMYSRMPLVEGPVDYVNYHLAGERIIACVQFGVYLFADRADGRDDRLVALVTGSSGEHGPQQKLRVEVMAARREAAQTFLAEVTARMRELNVYRGQVISLSPGQFGMGPQTLVAFHALPHVTRDQVVLPAGLLDRLERHTVVFGEQSERLLAAGRSLKRGLLLHGLPGTGKTLTVMYLVGRMPGRTTILTTGRGMGMIESISQLARTLAPAMVVVEDVDLIAEERGQPFLPTGPLLFELLNEMDGLRDDCDVIFVLTTNRPDILEPALAARPGRIDLAVELPLPDAGSRRRLLELYSRGLDLSDVDWGSVVERTAGVSPAYIKELLRKATLLAIVAGERVSGRHLEEAMGELNEGGRLAQRILGFRPDAERPERGRFPPGFPEMLRERGEGPPPTP